MAISYIISVISLLASFGVICMTYHVYVLNYRHTQIEGYLKQIVSLYYKIEEDIVNAKNYNNNSLKEELLSQSYKRIEMNATMMRYYVRKYPVKYEGKDIFEQVIESIIHSPELFDDYNKLGDEFKKFCKNIEIAKEFNTFIDRIMHYLMRIPNK